MKQGIKYKYLLSAPNIMSKLEQKIREILLRARISKAYKGYPYLEYAIYLVIEDESRLCHIYNDVYVKVAEHYGVAPSAVEKNLRTLRDAFWQNYGYEYFKEQCGIILYSRPFPREIIEILAEQVEKELRNE